MQLTVEAISKSGKGILSNGKWYNAKKFEGVNKGDTLKVSLDPTGQFVTKYDVVDVPDVLAPETTVTIPNPKVPLSKTHVNIVPEGNIDRRILVQGITQAVVQSSSLATFTQDSEGLVNVVKEVSDALIEYVLERSK